MSSTKTNRRQGAFSLVELSIVLVILGLLVGGVLSGQSLIHAAELRTVSSDYSRYYTATRTFRDKYFALPGDMPNATKFWGSAGGNGADVTCSSSTPAGTATCDGTGDGTLVDYQNIAGVGSQEMLRYWQHLVNAGLIEGSYTGQGNTPVIGTTVPASRIGSGTYWLVRTGFYSVALGDSIATSPSQFGGIYGRTMMRLINGNTTDTAGSKILKPEDAWNIDTKMDDGMPGTGKLWSNKGLGGVKTNCTSNAGTLVDAGATYLLTNTNKDCELFFVDLY